MSQHVQHPPPLDRLAPLGLPAGVIALLAKMLAKNPSDRPANYRELCGDIKMQLRTLPATAEARDPNATLLPAGLAANGSHSPAPGSAGGFAPAAGGSSEGGGSSAGLAVSSPARPHERFRWLSPLGLLCVLIPLALIAGWWFAQRNPAPGAAGATAVRPPAAPAAVAVPDAAQAAARARQEEDQEEKLLAAQEAQNKAAQILRVPKQYASIQAAIDAAKSGDTVQVSAGRYAEALHFKEGLRLIGDSRDTVTVVTPSNQTAISIINCGFGKVTEMTFEHTPPLAGAPVTATAAGSEGQPAVAIKNSGVQFVHCAVHNSAAHGIYVRGKDHSTIENCEVIGAGSDGIHVMDAGAVPTIRGNHVQGSGNNGIFFHMHGTGTVVDNISEKNAGSGIAMLGQDVNPRVEGNQFLENRKWGIQVERPAQPAIDPDNVLRGNDLGPTRLEDSPVAAPMPGM